MATYVSRGKDRALGHSIDVQGLDQPGRAGTIGPCDADSWVAAGQRRKIWWNIWKIEVFSSSMACKPCSIDLKDVAVRLPVADADWFAKNPVGSAVLIDHLRTAWKTLSEVGSENPLAWFYSGCIWCPKQTLPCDGPCALRQTLSRSLAVPSAVSSSLFRCLSHRSSSASIETTVKMRIGLFRHTLSSLRKSLLTSLNALLMQSSAEAHDRRSSVT